MASSFKQAVTLAVHKVLQRAPLQVRVVRTVVPQLDPRS